MVVGDPSSPNSSDDDRRSLGQVRLHPRGLLHGNPLPHLLLMYFELQVLKMPIKRSASQQASTASDDSSGGGNNRFVISPCPRRVTINNRMEVKEAPHTPMRKLQESLKVVLWLRLERQGQVTSSRKLSSHSSLFLNTL
jgi:hypothetical protein